MDGHRYREGKVGQWPIIDHPRQITPAAALWRGGQRCRAVAVCSAFMLRAVGVNRMRHSVGQSDAQFAEPGFARAGQPRA
jgi:hypothetical protein